MRAYRSSPWETSFQPAWSRMAALKTLCPHPAWAKTPGTWPPTALTRSWTGNTWTQEKLAFEFAHGCSYQAHELYPTKDVWLLFLCLNDTHWWPLMEKMLEALTNKLLLKRITPSSGGPASPSPLEQDKGLMWIARRPVRTCGLSLGQATPPPLPSHFCCSHKELIHPATLMHWSHISFS